jgi:hypothetical protein
MTKKTMPFATFMQTLRSTKLESSGVSGVEFLVPTEGGSDNLFLALTPCLNIRNKNFVGLFFDGKYESLELASIYITEDCPEIFNKQNRSEFFDVIRSKVGELDRNIRLLASSSHGLNLGVVGTRTQFCIASTVMLEFEADVDTITNPGTQVIIRYRDVTYRVTSIFFKNVEQRNRALFAYQFVGNVYAKSKSEAVQQF